MKKRPNNDGSISRYKGRWRGRYTDPITHRQKAVYAATQAECKAKLDAKLAEIRGGVYVAPDRLTVGGWLDFWFENFYRTGVKASTAATTESNIRTKLKPALGLIPLQKLTTEPIQGFIRQQQQEGLKGSTIRRYIKVLDQAITQAEKLNKLNRNPVKNVTLPPTERPDIPFLTREEQSAFLAVVPNTTGGRALRFLMGSGLRVSELCGLQWKDIQPDGLHIERINMTIKDLEEEGYINVTTAPKTKTGKRIIPLNPTLTAILEEQRRHQAAERLKAGSAWVGGDPGKGGGFIFANAIGRPSDRNNLNRVFRRLLDLAKLPRRGVHALRHTFATNWVQTNPDVPALARILGHSDPAFTYRTYCHADQRSMAQGMAEMEGYMVT